MIELAETQIQGLETHDASPPRVVNPQTNTASVLLRVDEDERLKEDDYDDSPWTRDELLALAWEAGKSIGWEDMDDYDDIPALSMIRNGTGQGEAWRSLSTNDR